MNSTTLIAAITAATALIAAITALIAQLRLAPKVEQIHSQTNATLAALTARNEALQAGAATARELAARPPMPDLPTAAGPPSNPG